MSLVLRFFHYDGVNVLQPCANFMPMAGVTETALDFEILDQIMSHLVLCCYNVIKLVFQFISSVSVFYTR